jgi:HlyD family secretion protein
MRRIVVLIPAGGGLKLATAMLTVVGISGAAFAFFVYGPTAAIKASTRPAVAAAASVEAGAPPAASIALASPGRIEGQSDSIDVGGAVDGIVPAVHVKEGQQVVRGQVLAELDCRELQSALPIVQAEAESLRQTRERLLRGSRMEEREAAAQKTASAKAVLDQASALLERNRTLVASDSISRVVFEETQRNASVAEAEFKQAQRHEQLINAGPLPEEIARANADLQAAEDRINLAQEKLAKCVIRAPIDGTILRIMLREGESFALVSPRPVLKIANIAGRRVRAEVDEHDVGRVHVGQRVVISSDAFSGRRFTGSVTRLAMVMGRKSVITGDPADKSDRDILEVVAQLQGATELPMGLRVTVEFVE